MDKVKICYIGVTWKDNVPIFTAHTRTVPYRETKCYYLYDGNKKLKKLSAPHKIAYIDGDRCFNAAHYAYSLTASTKDLYKAILASYYQAIASYQDWMKCCADGKVVHLRCEEDKKKYITRYEKYTERLANFEKAMKKFLNKYH